MSVLEGEELEKALLEYCKNASSAPDPAKVAEDSFAKGVGGTKADHLLEKQMGEMLRDTGDTGGSSQGTFFEQWISGSSAAAVKVSNGKKAPPPSDYANGKWIRTLNAQGNCYLYIHTTTYAMQGNRPEDFQGGEEAVVEEDPYASFPTAHLASLKDDIAAVWAKGQAPLLLAGGDEGHAAVLSALGTDLVLDVKPFVLGVIKTKIKFADHVETARKTLVKAMKTGGTAVIDLSDVGPPNWKEKICNVDDYKKTFPMWILDPNAHKEVDKHGQIFKKEDKKEVGDKDWDDALADSLPAFRFVYLSSCGPGDYEKNITLSHLPQGDATRQGDAASDGAEGEQNKWSALRVKTKQDTQAIPLTALAATLDDSYHRKGLVPLVSDTSENTDTFLAFQHTVVIEMKAVIMMKASQGIEAAREEMRKKLVQALKNGNILLLRLTNTAPELLEAFSSPDAFPAASLFNLSVEEIEDEVVEQQYGGFGGALDGATPGFAQPGAAGGAKTKGVSEVCKKEILNAFYKEEDKEAGAAIVRPGFKTVVTTNFAPEEVQAKLAASLPLHKCNIIAVAPS